jgi:hypothetical protein
MKREGREDWQVTPKCLQELIDAYNGQPKAMQAGVLDMMVSNPETAKKLAQMLSERREKVRQND